MAIRCGNIFTFIHIPKTAGTSISAWLRMIYDCQLSSHAHTKYHQLPSAWQDCTVAVVRNPMDRLLSIYKHTLTSHRNRQDPYQQLHELEKGFENYVINHCDTNFAVKSFRRSDKNFCWRKFDQHSYLHESTHVIRYENLNQEWKKFVNRHNIPDIPRHNVSNVEIDYKNLYNSAMEQTIATVWRQDCQKFIHSG